MAQASEDYLSMGRQKRIDLALSLDIHRSNAGAQLFKFMFGKKRSNLNKQSLDEQLAIGMFDLNKDTQPFLRKLLNRKLLDEQWIKSHIASLTFIMLWDILSETQPTIKDFYSLDREKLPDGFKIQPRETRRILKYYDYMHYHPVKWSAEMEKLADNPKNFVFSFRGPRMTRPMPSKKRTLKAVGTSLTHNKAWNPGFC